MCSEGTVVGSVCLSVCLSVTQHLTSPMFVRLTNDTTYLTGKKVRKFVRFSQPTGKQTIHGHGHVHVQINYLSDQP